MSEFFCDFTPPFLDPESLSELHSSRDTGQPLKDMIDTHDSILEFHAAPELTTDIEIAAIRAIAQSVKNSVEWQSGTVPWEVKSAGNCYTFTWLIADNLDRHGIDSRIVFTSGHTFNLVLGAENRFHIINGESPAMWIFDDKPNSLASSSFKFEELAEAGIHAQHSGQPILATFRTFELADYARMAARNRIYPYLGQKLPAATIMTNESGKRALFTYHYFQQALLRGDHTEVRKALEGLKVTNPFPETRKSVNEDLRQFARVVRGWAEMPQEALGSVEIMDVVMEYLAAMPETKGMLVLVGDCARALGVVRTDANYTQLAIDAYTAAAEKGPTPLSKDKTLMGKIKKAQKVHSAVMSELAAAEQIA